MKKLDLINEALEKGDIPKKDKARYYQHSKHHSVAHLKEMIKYQKKGKSFGEAHILTMKRNKKKK